MTVVVLSRRCSGQWRSRMISRTLKDGNHGRFVATGLHSFFVANSACLGIGASSCGSTSTVRGAATLVAEPSSTSNPSLSRALQFVGDTEIDALVSDGRPFVLHCGAPWSNRSKAVVEKLREWAYREDESRDVAVATTDMHYSPRLVEERHIRSMPAVLLFRAGRLEQRADGAGITELESILGVAEGFQSLSKAEAENNMSPSMALRAADELRRRGETPQVIAALYQRALDGGPSPHCFRARIGLLQCAVESAAGAAASPESRAEVEKVLDEIFELHGPELYGELVEAPKVMQQIAHAGLLVDAWSGPEAAANEAEANVLRHYAAGQHQEAFELALSAYQRAALSDVQGLVLAYAQPERPVPDSPRDAALSGSIWRSEALEHEITTAPGPVTQRALLRRLFAALGPTHPAAAKARVDLAYLLDTEEWVPWHTRRIFLRKGGKPKLGRGTGRRSGYSKGYWLCWGPDRLRKNTRPMGSPWSDKGD